ncbi:MAG: hypothetical protein IPL23_09970 [Saprospiraceae bacterium]|nr:hypothetical protein [Saprospiraceae bacterium]
MKAEDIILWESNILWAINNAADLELQKNAWLGKSPGIVSSFWEVISILYDDFGFEDYIVYYENTCGVDEFLLEMRELDKWISDYNPFDSQEQILSDPFWIEITKKAKITYDLGCQYKLKNEKNRL